MKTIFSRLFVVQLIFFVLCIGTFEIALSHQWIQGTYTVDAVMVLTGLVMALFSGFARRLGLTPVLTDLVSHSKTFDKTVSHLVEASQKMSSTSTQQAASIQEVVATIAQLDATIKKNAINAERSLVLAESSQKASAEGNHVVGEMIQAIDEINSSNTMILSEFDKGNEQITNIVKVIQEISQKTKIINDIVFQTKLLSFNASVEAARAGEHGKGFAVVAEEIGNLAEMSGRSSREISEMLNSSIQKVTTIVGETSNKVQSLVESGKAKVDTGIRVARRCGQVLEEVVKAANEVSHMVSEIATATKEQAQGMSEITGVMIQLDSVIQQDAVTAQNVAEYASELALHTNAFASALSFGNSRTNTIAPPRINPAASKPSLNLVPSTPPHEKPKLAAPEATASKHAVGSDIPQSNHPDFEDV